MIAFAPRPKDGDFSANHLGIIGDSADKRFTFVRSDRKVGESSPPEFILIIDWVEGDKFLKSCLSSFPGAHP